MRRRERNAIGTGQLNDNRRGGFRGEAVHGLQFHHFVSQSANDSPAAGRRSRCHRRRAKDDDPAWNFELRGMKKIKHRRQTAESTCTRSGEESERDDAHRFLGVIRAMAMGHPGRTNELKFAKHAVHEMRRVAMQENEQEEHE